MELNFTHLRREDFSLPMCTTLTSQHDNGSIVNDTNGNIILSQRIVDLSPVPLSSDTLDYTNIVIPPTLPKIDKKASALCAAVQVMSMVEENFIMDGKLYSSMSSWTKKSRSKIIWTNSTKKDFTCKMKVYVYIVNCDTLPLEQYGDLRKASDIWAAQTYVKIKSAEGGDVVIGLNSGEVGSEKTMDWFQMVQSQVKEREKCVIANNCIN